MQRGARRVTPSRGRVEERRGGRVKQRAGAETGRGNTAELSPAVAATTGVIRPRFRPCKPPVGMKA